MHEGTFRDKLEIKRQWNISRIIRVIRKSNRLKMGTIATINWGIKISGVKILD